MLWRRPAWLGEQILLAASKRGTRKMPEGTGANHACDSIGWRQRGGPCVREPTRKPTDFIGWRQRGGM